MPELPEAETARRYLEANVLGAKVKRVLIHTARSARSHESPEELASLVESKKIAGVGRRGKAVLLFLDGKEPVTLIIRLGMSGHVRVARRGEAREKHLAGVLELSDRREIRYIDARTFGLLVARPGYDVNAMPEFSKYGLEPLSEEFTAEYLKQVFSRRSVGLQVALMDQSVVVGMGKIYADEICFRAGLRPTRKVSAISLPKLQRLCEVTREILREAIELGGTSAGDEAWPYGNFQDRLNVYQRAGEPCRVCGTTIRRTAMPGGRGMHWCPACQK